MTEFVVDFYLLFRCQRRGCHIDATPGPIAPCLLYKMPRKALGKFSKPSTVPRTFKFSEFDDVCHEDQGKEALKLCPYGSDCMFLFNAGHQAEYFHNLENAKTSKNKQKQNSSVSKYAVPVEDDDSESELDLDIDVDESVDVDFGPGPMGLELATRKKGGVIVLNIDDGSKASRSGLVKQGMVVAQINGRDCMNLLLNEVLGKLKKLPRPVKIKFLDRTLIDNYNPDGGSDSIRSNNHVQRRKKRQETPFLGETLKTTSAFFKNIIGKKKPTTGQTAAPIVIDDRPLEEIQHEKKFIWKRIMKDKDVSSFKQLQNRQKENTPSWMKVAQKHLNLWTTPQARTKIDQLRTAMRFWMNMTAQKSWNSWILFCSEAKRVRKLAESAIIHWGITRLSYGFVRWFENTRITFATKTFFRVETNTLVTVMKRTAIFETPQITETLLSENPAPDSVILNTLRTNKKIFDCKYTSDELLVSASAPPRKGSLIFNQSDDYALEVMSEEPKAVYSKLTDDRFETIQRMMDEHRERAIAAQKKEEERSLSLKHSLYAFAQETDFIPGAKFIT